jgi:phosphorylcholine metabolism protein LicD
MKNIIIFGTGKFAEEAFHFYNLQDKINILNFSDNDKAKQNTFFNNIKVIKPTDILNIPFDEILIASSFDDEINTQLLNMGIDKKKIITLNLNEVKTKLIHGDRLALAEQLMIDISKLFNKKNISYHIDHGTLLGIIRDNSLIPWDIDVDFACKSEDKNIVLDTLKQFFKTYKSTYCADNNWRCTLHSCKIFLNNHEDNIPMVIKVFNDTNDITSNSFFVDIELKYTQDENLHWMVGSRQLFIPTKICFPTTSIQYKNTTICIPKETTQYLKSLYGDWKKVIKEWSYNQYGNIKGNNI